MELPFTAQGVNWVPSLQQFCILHIRRVAAALTVWRSMQNTTGRVERRWLNCLGSATWPEVVRRYCLYHPARFQDPLVDQGAGQPQPLWHPSSTVCDRHTDWNNHTSVIQGC